MASKKDNSPLAKSALQTAIALFIFAVILSLLWLIIYLLKEFLGIIFPITENGLHLVLAILATIGTAMYIYNSNKLEKEKEEIKKQIDLLKILSQELNFLEKNLKSYKNTFSGEKTYPFYELWSIDTSLYFKGLSHKINDNETIGLNKNLMIIKDKVLIIKNMKSESYKLEERGKEELVKYAIKGLRKQIGIIIDGDILPVIKKSKKIINNFLLK